MPRRKSVRRKTLKRKGRKPTTRSNLKAMRRSNRKSMRRSNRKTMRRSNRKAIKGGARGLAGMAILWTLNVSGLTPEILNGENKEIFKVELKKNIALYLELDETEITDLKIGDDAAPRASPMAQRMAWGEDVSLSSGTGNVTITFISTNAYNRDAIYNNLQRAVLHAAGQIGDRNLGDIQLNDDIDPQPIMAPPGFASRNPPDWDR